MIFLFGARPGLADTKPAIHRPELSQIPFILGRLGPIAAACFQANRARNAANMTNDLAGCGRPLAALESRGAAPGFARLLRRLFKPQGRDAVSRLGHTGLSVRQKEALEEESQTFRLR